APGHHVIGPPVQELDGVHDEEPRPELLGLGCEQRHRVSGLRLGGVLSGGQPLQFEGVPVVVVDDLAPLVGGDYFVGHGRSLSLLETVIIAWTRSGGWPCDHRRLAQGAHSRASGRGMAWRVQVLTPWWRIAFPGESAEAPVSPCHSPSSRINKPWSAPGITLARRSAPPGDYRALQRRQVLEHQGILGRKKVTERHLVKRKLPEEREDPVVVNLRPAWQADLLDVPAASFPDRVADPLDQCPLGAELEARWDGEGADRAHRHALDPAILAHRLVRPFPDQDTRIRDRPRLVDRFV